jgi:hypothetical protein
MILRFVGGESTAAIVSRRPRPSFADMSKPICCAALLLMGCATQKAPVRVVTPAEMIGQTHQPYHGRPSYLASAGLMHATRPVGESGCTTPTPDCVERLRAVLTALDGHVLALTAEPTPVQVQGLRLAIIELTPLLTPYPDMLPERTELGVLVEKLPTASPTQVPLLQKRMTELVDLMRIQLAGAQ